MKEMAPGYCYWCGNQIHPMHWKDDDGLFLVTCHKCGNDVAAFGESGVEEAFEMAQCLDEIAQGSEDVEGPDLTTPAPDPADSGIIDFDAMVPFRVKRKFQFLDVGDAVRCADPEISDGGSMMVYSLIYGRFILIEDDWRDYLERTA